MTLLDKLAPEEPAKYLVAKIREALAQDPRTNVLDVQVRVAAERVYLMGTLELEERREAVQTVVQELLPLGMTLFNNIAIACYSAEPAEEVV